MKDDFNNSVARRFMWQLQEYCQAEAIKKGLEQQLMTDRANKELQEEIRQYSNVVRTYRSQLSKIIFEEPWELMQQMGPVFKEQDPNWGYDDPSHKPH